MFWGHLETRRRHLPHWEGAGAVYFVTWSLARQQRTMSAAERGIVANALRHFEGDRYGLAAWVVMDDHVHVIVRPFHGWSLSRILHSWKSYTAHELVRERERTSPVWLDESYDRIVRDEEELARFTTYIVKNPQRRWPALTEYEWVCPEIISG
jgi:REP element-mobilizing transposase RayT